MNKTNRILYLFILLAIAYVFMVFLTPPNAAVLLKYHVSVRQAHIMSLTIALPLIGIWFLAFYGFSRFLGYVQTIKDTKDGKAFTLVTKGLFILAISLPISALISNITSYLNYRNPNFTPSSVIINNYVTLVMSLAAFLIIFRGTQQLTHILKKRSSSNSKQLLLLLIFGAISVLYAYLTLKNPARQFPTETASQAAYYLPDWLIVTTIIIPYILIWYLGIMSVFRLADYRKNTNGIIYKSSLGYLSSGLGFIIVSTVVIRYLTAFTTLLNKVSLNLLLVMLYALILLIGLGYGLVAFGAKKLKMIEEV